MRPLTFSVVTVLAVAVSLPAMADDQQKAEKQSHKITAMATDANARRIVSMTISDVLGVKRSELLRERRQTGLNYGSLFVAHQLISGGGATMTGIAAELKTGKTIWQIGAEQDATWKKIMAEAKKLNNKIEDNLYKRFVKAEPFTERDEADRYNPDFDVVKADYAVTQEEIEQAQNTYVFWRNHASARREQRLDTADEQAARLDHARSGGPQGRNAGMGSLPPAAGGLPPN
jgi:hypothetical protein